MSVPSATVAGQAAGGIAAKRPTETITAATAVAFLMTRFVGGVDSEQALTAWAAVIALVPVAVTWLVETIRSVRGVPGAIPPALLPVLDDLSDTASSALRKARAGENWKREVEAITAITAAFTQLDVSATPLPQAKEDEDRHPEAPPAVAPM